MLQTSQRPPDVPPENPAAEASLLGAILLDESVFEKYVLGKIEPTDLSRESHRIVLGALAELAASGRDLSFRSLTQHLKKRAELDAVGGAQFLVGLVELVPTVANAESYASIVRRTAILRRLIRAANEIGRLALVRESAQAAIAEAQEILFEISEAAITRETVDLGTAVRRYAAQILSAAQEKRVGIPSGLASLDSKTGGFHPSDLIVLAGRPSLGKTSLALSFVVEAGVRNGKTCAVFSLEMSETQLVQRMLSMTSDIEANRMRRGLLSIDDLSAVSRASGLLHGGPIFLEEAARLTVTQVLTHCRRLQAERGLDLVVIDYLQLIESKGDDENRVQEVARITRSLKAIARELQVPVIALSQLSRQIETRGTEPMLSDLRESGSIEQDADIVMFLWKDRTDREDGSVRLKLAKQRNGPTADINLFFQADHFRFTDIGEARPESAS